MMRGKKILVTGAAGFIGSRLVEELLALENQVVGLGTATIDQALNLQAIRSNPNFTYREADIRDPDSLKRAFTKDIQIVFHLASVVGVTNYLEDPFALIDISVMGTRNVAELALQYNTHIVFASSIEVYGRNPKLPWAEDDDRVLGSTQVDRWSYATAKACGEHVVLGLHHMRGVPATVVRYVNIYGPRQRPNVVIAKSIHRVLNGQRPFLYDGGTQTRCFTYIDDAVKGTIAAASNPKGNGEIFNIGDNTETTMKEVIELIIRHSRRNIQWEALNTREHYGKAYADMERRVPDIRKAKALLGWQTEVSLDEGIRRTIEWAKNTPGWLQGQ